MPLYAVRCEAGHEGEVLRTLSKRDDQMVCPLPSCGLSAHRVMSAFSVAVDDTPAYDDDYSPMHQVSRSRPDFIDNRMGDGKAALNHDTGGYRPACTHNTHCPKGHWANVAVLGEVNYGKRLNCDRCGYIWLYNTFNAEYPLREGYDPAFSAPQRYGKGLAIGGRRYSGGQRGA